MYYICAQPATFYYSWQIDAMLLSFERFGNVDLSKVHIVNAIQGKPSPHFKLVEKKWKLKGVLFEYYEDTRGSHSYISSIRPHILEKHWNKYPWLKEHAFLYHDSDIALTKPLPVDDKLNEDNVCYLSDTKSYVGAKYLDSKGHGILEQMCAIVGIPPQIVRNREEESGGAQYLIKPGITADFWKKVYEDSENLFRDITKRVKEIKANEPDWHEVQIWCADMWAVLWNLWKSGYKTPCPDDFEFSWGTQPVEQWDKLAIFHNAGVVKEESGQPFYKGKYQLETSPPINAPTPDTKWASHNYFGLIKDSWESTKKGHCLIIGNGTSVLDYELGEHIDKFDNIVRFNAYKIEGYEKHVGTKTDIWATCVPHKSHVSNIDSYKEVICHSWESDMEYCKIYRDLSKYRTDVWKIPVFVWRNLKKDFEVQDPSTGLLLINLMLDRYDEVWLYGFDWWDREEHHYSDKNPRGTLHKPDQELAYIKSLGNRVRFLEESHKETI